MLQSILGQGGAHDTDAIAAIWQGVIETVPYVTGVSNLVFLYSAISQFNCY
jgi:hypothetical protein